MTTNPAPIPEPTSPTAVVVAKLVASPKTGVDCCLWSKAFTGKYSMELGGFKIAPYNEPGPWLRGNELEAVMPTLKAGDVVEVEFEGHTATGKLWAHSPSGLSLWSFIVRTSDGNPGPYIDALRIIERAPEPEPVPGADIPNEVVEAALAAIPWASDHQLADVRAALAAADAKRAELIAAAPTLLAELADDVESERSLRIQMARELLVLTRAAELPDPSAEDFGGVGKRILAALGVES